MLRIWSTSGGGGVTASFTTIQTPLGTSPVATGTHDTLTLQNSDSNILITGNSGSDSVNFALATAIVTTGNKKSVDWTNRILYAVDGSSKRVDWVNGMLVGTFGNALDWINFALLDTSQDETLNWQGRVMSDIVNFYSLDWGLRRLLNTTGSFAVVDWANYVLADNFGGNSINWNTRVMSDATGVETIDYGGTRATYDSVGNISVSWDEHILYDSGGNSVLNWDTGVTGLYMGSPIINYNGYSTAGNGMASVVASVRLTAQTANLGPTTLVFTSGGEFRVNVYQSTNTTAAAGVLTTTIGWTDETSTARTNVPATNISLTANNFSQGTVYINGKSGSTLTYTTAIAGGVGGPKYNLYIQVERLS